MQHGGTEELPPSFLTKVRAVMLFTSHLTALTGLVEKGKKSPRWKGPNRRPRCLRRRRDPLDRLRAATSEPHSPEGEYGPPNRGLSWPLEVEQQEEGRQPPPRNGEERGRGWTSCG